MQRFFTKSEEAQMGDDSIVKLRPHWFRNLVLILASAMVSIAALAWVVA